MGIITTCVNLCYIIITGISSFNKSQGHFDRQICKGKKWGEEEEQLHRAQYTNRQYGP